MMTPTLVAEFRQSLKDVLFSLEHMTPDELQVFKRENPGQLERLSQLLESWCEQL